MAVARKNKRKITVDGVDYFWSVYDDHEHTSTASVLTLAIMSAGKDFIVQYPLHQQCDHNFLVVIGRTFGGNGDFGRTWQRVACPKFETGDVVGPQIVRDVIVWSLQGKNNVFVNYLGKPVGA